MNITAQPQVVATVISITGLAFARGADGSVRKLLAGDSILLGETVFTVSDGQVELAFSDGHTATILPLESFKMGAEAMIATSPDAGDAAIDAAGEAEKVIAALEQGDDILENLDPTAAGNAGGGETGGNDFVRLLRIVEPVTPVGFAFGVRTVEDIRAPEGDVIPEEEEDLTPSLVAPPTAQLDDDDVNDDGIPDGVGDDAAPLNSSGTLAGSGGDGDLDYYFNGLSTLPDGFTYNPVDASTVQILQGTTVVLTITLNNETGDYSVVQNNPIDHPDGDDENNLTISVGVYTQDEDGDQSTPVNITINIDDDTPIIDVALADVAVDALVVDETNLAINASANFADNFGATSSYGADGAGTTTTSYSLGVKSTGVDSGLNDVATGSDILLYLESGVVVGRVGGPAGAIAFTVSVDAAGTVSLDQQRALTHPDGTNPDDAVSLAAADLISITRSSTITDRDGDSATDSASINIGTALSFKDDGPSIDVTVTAAADALVVDETNLAINASANFADNFGATSSYGADGAGTTTTSYSLGVKSTGVDSGLNDVATGSDILLYLESGVVVGRVGGPAGAIAFTVSVDAAGTVSLDQQRALTHPDGTNPDDAVSLAAADLISITRSSTITDRDGDSATDSASINIGTALSFKDDGPSIDVTVTAAADALVVDETNLAINASANFADNFGATSSYGADGAGTTTTSYSLGVKSTGVDSGLNDVATGSDILLYLESGVVVGRVGGSAGAIAFTVSVDAAGTVSLDQQRALTHPDGTNPDDAVSLAAADLISITRSSTITDRDGDSATDSASINIGTALSFKDDGPSIDVTVTAAADALVVDETNLAINASANFADNFGATSSYGADGAGTTTTSYSLGVKSTGVDSGLNDVATGSDILLYLESGVVVGRVGGPAGAIAFTVSVDAAGTVSLDQQRALTHPDGTNPDDAVSLAAADLVSITRSSTITDRDGDSATDSASINIGTALSFKDDGPSAVNEITQSLFEGFTTTTDALVGTVDVPASNASSNFVLVTTLNGITGGDTMNINWSTNGSTTINWELRPVGGGAALLSGSGNGTSLSTTLGLLATGNYELWIDATNKEITVEDVTFEHEVSQSVGGNVLDNGDSFGADGPGMVSAITYTDGSGSHTMAIDADGVTVTTLYGTLTINQDGTYTYSAFANAVPDNDADGKVTDSFTYTIMDGDGDTDTATMNFEVRDVPDVVPSAAFFTMNTSNTGGGGDTGFQQFRISITDGNFVALSQVVEIANEEGQQDFFVTMGGDVEFNNNSQYTVTLEHVSGSAHLNFTDFSITDINGTIIPLNGPGGNNNVTLTGEEDGSYDGVIYTIMVNGSGVATASDPVGYDLNTAANGDEVLVLGTPTGQLSFMLDMSDLPIGSDPVFDTNLFGQIDRIDIAGASNENNTLTLSAQDVLDLVDADNTLWISGNGGDAVVLADEVNWTPGANNTPGPDGGTYTTYTATIDSTLVTINVDNDVTQP